MEPLGLRPGLVVDDFDSHPDPHLPVETITLPCEKDDTDTVYAVKESLRRGYREFLLLGAAGGWTTRWATSPFCCGCIRWVCVRSFGTIVPPCRLWGRSRFLFRIPAAFSRC